MACNSVFSALDMSELDAIFSFLLAPLATRRDIAILGMIHRTVLCLGPNVFQQFFCLARSLPSSSLPPLRLLASAHSSSGDSDFCFVSGLAARASRRRKLK
eukprot:9479114-Pyramimonas_sp.AAC.1